VGVLQFKAAKGEKRVWNVPSAQSILTNLSERRHHQPSPRRLPKSPITFRWKDYAHGNHKRMLTVSAHEFLRRS